VRPNQEKNPSKKRAGGVAQDIIGPEFKPQYHKKKKGKKNQREREMGVGVRSSEDLAGGVCVLWNLAAVVLETRALGP
jgi:hypothetical protein